MSAPAWRAASIRFVPAVAWISMPSTVILGMRFPASVSRQGRSGLGLEAGQGEALAPLDVGFEFRTELGNEAARREGRRIRQDADGVAHHLVRDVEHLVEVAD